MMLSENKKFKVVANHKSDLLSQDVVLRGIYQYSNFRDYGLSFDFRISFTNM